MSEWLRQTGKEGPRAQTWDVQWFLEHPAEACVSRGWMENSACQSCVAAPGKTPAPMAPLVGTWKEHSILRYPKEVNQNEIIQGAMEMGSPAVSLTWVLSLHISYIGGTGWF